MLRKILYVPLAVIVLIAAYSLFWPVPIEHVAWEAQPDPGFSDNISKGRDGRFWVALVIPRVPALTDLSEKPFLRKVIYRIPSFLQPKTRSYGHIIGLDQNGKVLLPVSSIPMV